MSYQIMMDTMEPQGHGMAADILTSEVASAKQRINRTEIAIKRTEEMLAANIALRSRMRFLVEATDRLMDPPSSNE
ncbi:hypothetical protein NKH57_27960 [Mesorhizobium sp. M1050]|uniref:hypothetical protein n=1 Tax=unclassified Mesorhizobium TaxID=325217 RepID=UPI0003CE3E2B|nr:hypothetical protein [Mesorhizobium sp. LNHC252B00]ESY64344.1 hypothetical protein X743_31240 [Mesorhizobium sp. LNHC252B00]